MANKTKKELVLSNGIRIKGDVTVFAGNVKTTKEDNANQNDRSHKPNDKASRISKRAQKEKQKIKKTQKVKQPLKPNKVKETEAEIRRKAAAQKRIEQYHKRENDSKASVHSSFSVMQKRKWILDWNCVMFKKGYIVIYARQELSFKFSPQKVLVSQSLESFNYLKKYLNERLSPVHCEIDGLKLKIIDRINFDEAIQQFAIAARQGIIKTTGSRTTVISSPLPMSFSQALSKANQMTEDEFRKYKSKYIDFLVIKQSKKYKVIPCVERLAHTNSDITEYAFMFSIECSTGRILIVHENVNPDRSSLLFLVKHEHYNKAIRAIYDFLQGAEINKRSNLRSKDLDLDNTQIVSYKSINHDDINSWKHAISTYITYR